MARTTRQIENGVATEQKPIYASQKSMHSRKILTKETINTIDTIDTIQNETLTHADSSIFDLLQNDNERLKFKR